MTLHQPFTVPPPAVSVDLVMRDGAVIRLRRYGRPGGTRIVCSHGNGLAINAYAPFWLLLADRYDVVVSRDGRNKSLSVHRRSFVPVLGAEFREQDGALVVSRIVPGEASTAGLQEGDRVVSVAGKDVQDEASLQAALRSLTAGSDALSAVIYIVRVAPDVPLRSAFATPPERTLPRDFPAPYLLLQGMTPIAARWTSGVQGSVYEATLLTRQSPGDRP